VNAVAPLVWVVLLGGVFYLMIIRPTRNRARAQQQLSDRLGIGARVMTTSGLFAEVVGFDDDAVLLETAPGVTMRWTKAAVARSLPEPEAEDDSVADEPDSDDPADDPSDDPDATNQDSTDRPT
jgi:preprotein translocase subunit YajC